MPQTHDISSLTLAIVAGGFAIGGTVVGQFFGLLSGWIQRRHDVRLRKRQMLEKMVDLESESLSWFARLLSCRTIDDYRAAKPPLQTRHIALFARMSFPNLVEPATRYANGCIHYYSLVGECYNPQIPATMGAQLVLAAQNSQDVANREREILTLRNLLDEAIVAETKKLGDL
jgi:hypothetical protein